MSLKNVCASALTCTVLLGCLSMPAGAANYAPMTETPALSETYTARAAGSFDITVSAGKILVIGDSISLEKGDTVTFDCTYSPKSADIDIGLIASDGSAYYVSGSNGSINKSIRISKRGSYTLAVRNNSSTSVTVTGIINY